MGTVLYESGNEWDWMVQGWFTPYSKNPQW